VPGLGFKRLKACFLNNQKSFNFANALDGYRPTALKSVMVAYELSGGG
jgi:hypothetical protein